MSPVRDIAGVVSSGFARAIKWGLVSSNPVGPSEPPVPKRRSGLALNPSQQRLLIESASGYWCLPTLRELAAATGARRGELLALRWSNVHADALSISRSLSQTRAGLSFKETKNQSARLVIFRTLPYWRSRLTTQHRKFSGKSSDRRTKANSI